MSSRVFGKYYSALLLVRKVQSSTSGPAGRLPSTRLAGWSDSSLVLLVGLIYNVHYTNDVLSLSDTSPWSAKSFLFQSLKSCHSYSERPTSPSVDPNNHRFIGFDMYLFRRQKQIHRRHERSQKGNAEKTNTATCTRWLLRRARIKRNNQESLIQFPQLRPGAARSRGRGLINHWNYHKRARVGVPRNSGTTARRIPLAESRFRDSTSRKIGHERANPSGLTARSD